MAEIIYLVCPLCGKNQPLIKYGKYRFSFERNAPDPKTGVFIDIREGGGKKEGTGKGYPGSAKGSGFKRIDYYSLKDIIEIKELNKDYQDLIIQLKLQIQKIQQIIE